MSEPINHTTDAEATRGLTRRQVTKAAAWAAPVVALAVATPMAAASVTLSSSGALSFNYNTGTGVVELLGSTFGITGTGTPGAPQSTGVLSILVEFPSGYTPSVTTGALTNGWTVAVGAEEMTLFYNAGLTLSAPGSVNAPSFSPITFTGPAGLPPRRSFAFTDSWANFPDWGYTAVWPK